VLARAAVASVTREPTSPLRSMLALPPCGGGGGIRAPTNHQHPHTTASHLDAKHGGGSFRARHCNAATDGGVTE
jgi:hypothetical protein